MAPFNSQHTDLGDARLSDSRLGTPIPLVVEDILLTVQAFAVVTTIAQYLSPYPVIRKIVKQNNTGSFSYFPYLANFLNATLTAVYGFLKKDNVILLVNSFGVTITGAYLIMYQRYYPPGKRVFLLKIIFSCCLTIWGTCHYATIILEEASGQVLMGAAQNFASCVCFVAPLATLRLVWERQSAESVPLLLTIMNFVSSLAWFFYGILIDDKFVSFPNGLGVILSLVTFSQFLVYPPPRLNLCK